MFGYACNEAPEFMPAPIYYSHRLVEQQAKVRKSGKLKWLRPDAKSQVTLRYETDTKSRASTRWCCPPSTTRTSSRRTWSRPCASTSSSRCCRRSGCEALPKTKIHINPTGIFVIGGPVGDCGLTGRKIIVDTYGGMARHGGGAFSGKDPSKVDRSAAYAARYVAKNIVAAGLADRCEVQVSYAIGVAEPTSISVTTFGTGKITDEKIEKLIRSHFDLRPYGIIKMLDLIHPIYQQTAAYGHFGRKPKDVSYTDAAGKQAHRHRLHLGKDRQGRGTAHGGEAEVGPLLPPLPPASAPSPVAAPAGCAELRGLG